MLFLIRYKFARILLMTGCMAALFCSNMGQSVFAETISATISWQHQIGTNRLESSYGVHADRDGNVYLAGMTGGSLEGTKKGEFDAYIAKYNSAGELLWNRQIGTSATDVALSITSDHNGNVFAVGDTNASLVAGAHQGTGEDGYLIKYNSAGVVVWTRQFGTSARETAASVTTDSVGNIYVAGYTEGDLNGEVNNGQRDAFVTKYNTAGVVQWTRLVGGANFDVASSVTVDSENNVYISGYTEGGVSGPTAGGVDAFFVKFNSNGELQMKRQYGSDLFDDSLGVKVDSLGGIYLVGKTTREITPATNLAAAVIDADGYLIKYNNLGELLWERKISTDSPDSLNAISISETDEVFVAGDTFGVLGEAGLGNLDLLAMRFDTDGNQIWKKQIGTQARDETYGIAHGADGEVYLSGHTFGTLTGETAHGNVDIFLMRINQIVAVPEPASLLLFMIGFVGFIHLLKKRRVV